QQADADTSQNINDRFNQPTHDVGSKMEPQAPDQNIYESDDERMELFGGQNRYQIKLLLDLNPFESNTDQFTDFPQQADSLQQDIDQKKVQNQQQKQLIQENKETYKDLQYIGGLDWGQKPVHQRYGKQPNEPYKVVDYKITDQGELAARQRKILLSKEDRINLDRLKTHKIAANRIISQIKAQEQLKNKLRRKRNENHSEVAISQGSFSNAFLIVLTAESTTLFLLTKGDELQNWVRSVGAATPKLPLQCTSSIPPIANVGRH
ncbi:MAG: hypothetical protein EZS28_036509, partial [Streblomastix strix]